MHGDGIGGVHEDVRHAHQVLDGLQLQAQQVPVKGLPADGLQKGVWSGAGAMGLQGATALPRSLWQQHLFHSVAPGTCETSVSGQESPHCTGRLKPSNLPGEAGHCRI